MLVTTKMRAFVSSGGAVLLGQLPDSSPESTSTTGDRWSKKMAAAGHQFIPIQPTHISLFAVSHNCDEPDFERVFGHSLVDRHYLPLACAGLYFEPEGTVTIFAHLGRWMEIYPVPILRLTRQVFAQARAIGVKECLCIAEEAVGPRAKSTIEYFGGEETGKSCEFGPIYKLDLTRCKL